MINIIILVNFFTSVCQLFPGCSSWISLVSHTSLWILTMNTISMITPLSNSRETNVCIWTMCAQATEPIKCINVLLICYTLPEFGMAMEMHLFVLSNLTTYNECICNYTLKYTLHKEKNMYCVVDTRRSICCIWDNGDPNTIPNIKSSNHWSGDAAWDRYWMMKEDTSPCKKGNNIRLLSNFSCAI